MICPKCAGAIVMVRSHPDCACNPAPSELVAAEVSRLKRGGKLLVRHVTGGVTWYRTKLTTADKGHDRGWSADRARAERYEEPPARGPDAAPWDLVDDC